jgi:hypothetical protein
MTNQKFQMLDDYKIKEFMKQFNNLRSRLVTVYNIDDVVVTAHKPIDPYDYKRPQYDNNDGRPIIELTMTDIRYDAKPGEDSSDCIRIASDAMIKFFTLIKEEIRP